MRFFALAQDVALDTHRIHCTYRGVDNPQVLANKKDTHFNCLNKQHSLNSCP